MRNTVIALVLLAVSAAAISSLMRECGAGDRSASTALVTGALSGLTVGLSEPVVESMYNRGDAEDIQQARTRHPSEWRLGRVVGTIGLLGLIVVIAMRARRRRGT